MGDAACLGEQSEVYNLGPVVLGDRATVAQQAYLCAGTHDFADLRLPLVVGPITIGAHAFVGVRALVLPGAAVGEGAVVGAGAVVTKDVPPWTIAAGNPCRPIRRREVRGGADGGTAAAGAVEGASQPAGGGSAQGLGP
jgi:putative colanic acid biosynthesis acetyltransferase WcaF